MDFTNINNLLGTAHDEVLRVTTKKTDWNSKSMWKYLQYE